jgi:hypothetical protein
VFEWRACSVLPILSMLDQSPISILTAAAYTENTQHPSVQSCTEEIHFHADSRTDGDPDSLPTAWSLPAACKNSTNACPSPTQVGFENDPQVQRLSDLFTVDLINRYIERKLHESGEREQAAA